MTCWPPSSLVAELVCSWGGGAVLSDGRRWVPAALDRVDEQTPPDAIAKLSHAEAVVAMYLYNHHKVQLAGAQKAQRITARSAMNCASFGRSILSGLRSTTSGAIPRCGRSSKRHCRLPEIGHSPVYRNCLAQFRTGGDGRGRLRCGSRTPHGGFTTYRSGGRPNPARMRNGASADLTFHQGGNPESAVRQLTDVLAKGRCFHSPRHITVHTQIFFGIPYCTWPIRKSSGVRARSG